MPMIPMRTVALDRLDLVDEDLPLGEIGVDVAELEDLADDVVEALLVEDERDLVEVAGVGRVDDGVDRHVAEVGDLALQPVGERLLAAHTMASGWMPRLRSSVTECCVGLVFCSADDHGRERDVHVADVVAADVEAELPDGLEEREDLDVADRAADLGDDDVDVVAGQARDAALDLVGDVRDDLHGLAEVVAAALGGQHRRVDRAGGGVGVAGEVLVDEPLVVAEVEVGLAAVVGDEHLAVLERVHRARVDVDVRVELLHRDPQAAGLQQPPERRGGDALAEGRGHAPRDEDVLGHRKLPVCGSVDAVTGAQPTLAASRRPRTRSMTLGQSTNSRSTVTAQAQ